MNPFQWVDLKLASQVLQLNRKIIQFRKLSWSNLWNQLVRASIHPNPRHQQGFFLVYGQIVERMKCCICILVSVDAVQGDSCPGTTSSPVGTTVPMMSCWPLPRLHRCLPWTQSDEVTATTPLYTATLTGRLSVPEEGRKERKLVRELIICTGLRVCARCFFSSTSPKNSTHGWAVASLYFLV